MPESAMQPSNTMSSLGFRFPSSDCSKAPRISQTQSSQQSSVAIADTLATLMNIRAKVSVA